LPNAFLYQFGGPEQEGPDTTISRFEAPALPLKNAPSQPDRIRVPATSAVDFTAHIF
jgi:hypothetical protein